MIELRCLGSIDLRIHTQAPATRVIAQPKRFALFTYLALANPRGFHRRDKLIALFWPEADDEHARSGLRIALSFLRRELGDEVILTRGDDVGVNQNVVRCDVIDFESLVKSGQLEKALSLYHGEILPGLHVSMSPGFERWLEAERDRLKGQAHSAALKLSARDEDAGIWDAAIKWLRFALDLAPEDEAVVQRLIKVFDCVGDRAGALRAYESFAARMAEEFDVQPSPETRALIAGIRARAGETPAIGAGTVQHSAIPVSNYPQPVRKHQRRGLALMMGGLFALLAISSAGALLWQRQPHGSNSRRPRIAIVALQNQTGRANLDFIGGMVADEIAHLMGERGVGDVVTLTGLPNTKTSSAPDVVREVSEATGARVVVTGGYTLEGDSVLLRVEVADADKQRLLAVVGPLSAPAAKPSDGIAIVSSEVLSSVARVVEPRLSRYMEQKGWSRPVPIETYRASSEGFELFLGSKSTADYEKAIERFAHAYALDSTEINALFEMAIIEQSLEQWARADSLLVRIEPRRGRMTVLEADFFDLLRARNRGDHHAAYEVARDAIGRLPGVVWEYTGGYHALSSGMPHTAAKVMHGLNPDDGFYKGVPGYRGVMAEAHHVLGEHTRELELARMQRERQPELLSTALYETRALAALGRTGGVQKVVGETQSLPAQSGLIPGLPRLRGLSPGLVMVEAGLELHAHGHARDSREMLDRAIGWYRSHLTPEAQSEPMLEGLGEALYLTSRWEEADSVFRVLAQRSPTNVDYQGRLGLIAVRLGHNADVIAATKTLEKVNQPYLFGRATLWRARLAAQVGDLASAITLLHQALAEGTPFGIWVHRDVDLEPLRSVPSFAEFIAPRG